MTIPWDRCVVIGDATLYQGDCVKIMATLDPVDATVTDPPYGINIAAHGTIGGAGKIAGGGRVAEVKDYGKDDWDKEGLSVEQWEAILRAAPQYIVWGGNHLADVMGSSKGVLVWDKKCLNGWEDTFSDAEIAWTNSLSRAKMFRHLWVGALRASEKGANVRQHPTQKPIALMEWCLSFVKGQTIIDPFMGSGTTGVACIKQGRKFIGIERESKYFDVSCKRIEAARLQGDMFIEPAKAVQEELL